MLITQERLNELLSRKGNERFQGIKTAVDRSATKTALNKVNLTIAATNPPEKVLANQLPHDSGDQLTDLAQLAEMLREYVTRLLAAQAQKDEWNKNFIPVPGAPVSEPRARLRSSRKAEARKQPAEPSGVFAGILGGGASMKSKGSGEGFTGTLFRPRARKGEAIKDPLPSAIETAVRNARNVKEFAQRHGKLKQDSLSDVFGSSMR